MGSESDEAINIESIKLIAQEIADLRKMNVDVVIVIGGGNIFRGVKGAVKGINRATADYMGMLATIMNFGFARCYRENGCSYPSAKCYYY